MYLFCILSMFLALSNSAAFAGSLSGDEEAEVWEGEGLGDLFEESLDDDTTLSHENAPAPLTPLESLIQRVEQLRQEALAGGENYSVENLNEMHNLLTSQAESLSTLSAKQIQDILVTLGTRASDYRAMAYAFEALEESILSLKDRDSKTVLKPFRDDLIQFIKPTIHAVFEEIYEYLYLYSELNPDHLPAQPTEGPIDTLEKAEIEAVAVALRASTPEIVDAFKIAAKPLPNLKSLKGRWQARSQIALNLILNHLNLGEIERSTVEMMLISRLVNAEIPENFRSLVYGFDFPNDVQEVYPMPENPILSDSLRSLEDLQFKEIADSYHSKDFRTEEIRKEIVEAGRDPVETVEGLSRRELGRKLNLTRLLEKAKRVRLQTQLDEKRRQEEREEFKVTETFSQALRISVETVPKTEEERRKMVLKNLDQIDSGLAHSKRIEKMTTLQVAHEVNRLRALLSRNL